MPRASTPRAEHAHRSDDELLRQAASRGGQIVHNIDYSSREIEEAVRLIRDKVHQQNSHLRDVYRRIAQNQSTRRAHCVHARPACLTHAHRAQPAWSAGRSRTRSCSTS